MTRIQWRAAISRCCLLIIQVGALMLLAFGCDQLALWLGLPIPGSVLGLALVLILLGTQSMPERAIQLGAAWLIGDLLLFFIPPVVSVLHFESLLETYGVQLLLLVVIGTACVMIGTGWMVDKLFTLEQRYNQAKQARLESR
ncbi:CidA/LrgA family protein [Shewanella sp. NIFS-20-20]|uniref:CidA/LrgA family protein n=1 Tax=Shewanella sp. NIFS-20-20 TaxID=2853806 RepID=UPI001C46E68C|nr:CidA/LrgA family protein [Shewanella sp. NIFS-20-20]MBV7315841.1 CidA/LrgA family protein [Shewanella sp. NIFS-20-20]